MRRETKGEKKNLMVHPLGQDKGDVLSTANQSLMANTSLDWLDVALGGTKNTIFWNSMGALSNPISLVMRCSEQFLESM